MITLVHTRLIDIGSATKNRPISLQHDDALPAMPTAKCSIQTVQPSPYNYFVKFSYHSLVFPCCGRSSLLYRGRTLYQIASCYYSYSDALIRIIAQANIQFGTNALHAGKHSRDSPHCLFQKDKIY